MCILLAWIAYRIDINLVLMGYRGGVVGWSK